MSNRKNWWNSVVLSLVLLLPRLAFADWLSRVNLHRQLAGLPPVTENPAWSDGCQKHARYMVKNNFIGHTEDPSNLWYTPEGLAAAQSSNLIVSSGQYTDEDAIDGWMDTPFHGIGIIDPRLLQVGFGSYRESTSGFQTAACLDILRGQGALPNGITFPIKYPQPGASALVSSYGGGESPDPLTSCPGYTAPTGPPVILQLGSGNVTPQVTAHSFSQGGTPLAHCVFDETNYTNLNIVNQTLGRQVLGARDTIILLPRFPLSPGVTYTASITANGQSYTWSFVGAQSQQTCALDCATSFAPTCSGPGWGAVGGLTPSAPQASVDAAGRVRLFVRGVDNGIWQNIDAGSGFTGWTPVGGLTESSLAAVVDAANRVRLFARGVDNGIWQNIDAGSGFQGWTPVGGLTPDALAAVLDGANCVRLFARGVDNGIWQNRDCGGGFQGWAPVGGLTPSAPAAVVDVAGHVRLFVRGVDDGIWQNTDTGGGFTGWTSLGGMTHTALASVLDDNDDLHLYARGVDERVWENVLPFGGCPWMGWQPIRADGQTPNAPAAVSDVSGVLRLFARGVDAGIYEVDSQ